MRPVRGNALVIALLGLLVSAIGALGALQGARLQAKRDAGLAEASILDALRNAANNAIFESMGAIQAGGAISKNGVTVAPEAGSGETVWSPTIAQLAGMGYLPSGWATTVSTLNNAAYQIAFQRVPAGCVVAACNIEGHVVLAGPVRSGPTAPDGAVIGPILTRLGADAGVSLLTDPATITGFGRTWTLVNPVAGQPAGVIAVRIGTAASAFGQFVRIGDTRDPDLAGKLTVAGDTLFGGPASTSEFRGRVQVDGQPVSVQDGSGDACVVLRPTGAVEIHCDGLLDAATGTFHDAAGRVSTIAATGIATTGEVSAADGFRAAAVTAFAGTDPTAIVVRSGDLLVRGPGGGELLRVSATGDVTAAGQVAGRSLTLAGKVVEGDACRDGQVALLTSGGLATCLAGRYAASARFAGFGSACAVPGQPATDPTSGDALVCRGGAYASLSGLLSSRVLMASYDVVHGSVVNAADAMPNGCPALAAAVNPAPRALLYLLPGVDVTTAGNVVLNRTAQWTGNGWTVSLTDGAGAPTASKAIAQVFCDYG